MIENDSLFLWRLATDLSVQDAAILIAGGDPSAMDYESEDPIHSTKPVATKRTWQHTGFTATFTSLKNAVIRKDLQARVAYPSHHKININGYFDPDFWVITKKELAELLGPDKEFAKLSGSIEVSVEPDWSKTTIDIADLKSWLRSRGVTKGFFFPVVETESDDFMDPTHDHFAPELALAVSAWRGLASERKFKRGTKAAVDAWIEANPDAWKGDGDLSISAKERVATCVNWRRSGGAPASDG